jgi:hypothetical protein
MRYITTLSPYKDYTELHGRIPEERWIEIDLERSERVTWEELRKTINNLKQDSHRLGRISTRV